MDVRVGRYPALGAIVSESRNLEVQLTLSGADAQFLADSLVFEAFRDFNVNIADRKLYLEGAINICEGGRIQDSRSAP